MTKNQLRQEFLKLGYSSCYSGHSKTFYLTNNGTNNSNNQHLLVNLHLDAIPIKFVIQ